jgi:hypothetical protein
LAYIEKKEDRGSADGYKELKEQPDCIGFDFDL